MSTQINTKDYEKELTEMTAIFKKTLIDYQALSESHQIKGIYAEWHIHGLRVCKINCVRKFY